MNRESSGMRRSAMALLTASTLWLWSPAVDAQTQGEDQGGDDPAPKLSRKDTKPPENADTRERETGAQYSETAPSNPMSFAAAPGIALYASGQGGEWQRLCLAPCDLPAVPSPPFALSLDGSEPVAAENSPRVRAGTVLEGQYRSRVSTRSAGWIVLGLGVPSGLATIASGAAIAASDPDSEPQVTIGVGTAIGGGVVLLTTLIVGAILASRPDEAHVHVRQR